LGKEGEYRYITCIEGSVTVILLNVLLQTFFFFGNWRGLLVLNVYGSNSNRSTAKCIVTIILYCGKWRGIPVLNVYGSNGNCNNTTYIVKKKLVLENWTGIPVLNDFWWNNKCNIATYIVIVYNVRSLGEYRHIKCIDRKLCDICHVYGEINGISWELKGNIGFNVYFSTNKSSNATYIVKRIVHRGKWTWITLHKL